MDRRCLDTVCQIDAACPCNEQTEGDGLRIAVRELRIIRRWKQKVAPVLGKSGQALIALCHLLDHFLAQEAAEARAGLGKLLGRLWWNGLPVEEIRNQRAQRFRRLEFSAGCFDVAIELD